MLFRIFFLLILLLKRRYPYGNWNIMLYDKLGRLIITYETTFNNDFSVIHSKDINVKMDIRFLLMYQL
jgi:hypothetical protein